MNKRIQKVISRIKLLIEQLFSPAIEDDPVCSKQEKPYTDSPKIFGRNNELNDIDNLFKENSALAITGSRGIGKTTVASMYMDKVNKQKKFSKIYWRKMEETTDIIDVAGCFLFAIGKCNKKYRDYHTKDILNKLYTELNDKPYFLVLDNFQVLLDHSINVPRKPGFSDLIERASKNKIGSSKILFTSWTCLERDKPIKPYCYKIEGLDNLAGKDLLKLRLKDVPDAELYMAVKLTGGNPLALKLLTQLLVNRDVATCRDILDKLENILEQLKYLFSWDEIPGNDNARLIGFLNRYLAKEWVKTAEIEKIGGGRVIKVSTANNFLSLSLNDEKTKVNLIIDDVRIYEFIAKTENSKLNIYEEGEVVTKIMDKVYDDILDNKERKVLQYISVYRMPIPIDPIFTVATDPMWPKSILKKRGEIEVTAERLIDKSLLQKTKTNNYWEESLINDYAYDKLDNIDEVHRLAYESYRYNFFGTNYEKTTYHQYFIEALYHLIKSNMKITKEDIKYFMDLPKEDTYLFFIINEVIQSSEIENPDNIFELIEGYIESKDPKIIISFLLSYGHYFENIYHTGGKKSFEVYHNILKLKEFNGDNKVLEAIANSVSSFTNFHPDECLKIWEELAHLNEGLTEAVVFYISNVDFSYLFNWDSVPGNESEKLLKFLADNFDVNWVKTAEIYKDSKTIIIANDEHLFSWDGITGKDYEGLINFLNQNYNIEWVKTAEIEKIEGGNTIRVFANNNFLLLELNDKKTKVNLKINDNKTGEFIVKAVNGELNIYEKNLAKIVIREKNEKATLELSDGRIHDLKIKMENGKLNIYSDIYLFTWKSVLGNNSNRLRRFLKYNFDIDWVATAKICKCNDIKTILISNDGNSVTIDIDDKYENATLKLNNGITYDLNVKLENGELNIYADLMSMKYIDFLKSFLNQRPIISLSVSENNSEEILKFLLDKLGINWTKNAKITKSNDNKTILTCNHKNVAEIVINEKEEKATLKLNNGITYDLKVKVENNQISIYQNVSFTTIQRIKIIFRQWGIKVDTHIPSIKDQLSQIRMLKKYEHIQHIKVNYEKMNPAFTLEILSKYIKDDSTKIEVCELISEVVKYHAQNSRMMIFQASEILYESIKKEEDLKCIKFFIENDDENNLYTLLAGIQTLDLLSSKYLFRWDKIPGNDNVKLIEFLKQEFEIDWLKTAEIKKIDKDNTIKVTTKINQISLNLNKEQNEVKLTINNDIFDKYKLIAKYENNKLKIYSNLFKEEVLLEYLKPVIEHKKYFFRWDKIPGNDNVRLIEYLNRHFTIEWIKTAKIEKIDGGRAIKLSTGNKSLSLSLNDEKTKVYLKSDDDTTYEFIAKTENSKLNIYHKNITIHKLAELTTKIIKSNNKNRGLKPKTYGYFQIFRVCLHPRYFIPMLQAELFINTPFVMAVWMWATKKTAENHDVFEIRDVCSSAICKKNSPVLDASVCLHNRLQAQPKKYINLIYKYAYKSQEVQVKFGSVALFIFMSDKEPEIINKCFKKIIADDNEYLVLFLLEYLRLYTKQDMNVKNSMLELLINHDNPDISGFSDFLLYGI